MEDQMVKRFKNRDGRGGDSDQGIQLDAIRVVWQVDDMQARLPEGWDEDEDGDYEPMGCVAEAQVSYSIGGGNRRIEWLSSGGLWGVTISSSSDPYKMEVENDELADLKLHLERFGVDLTRWDDIEAAWRDDQPTTENAWVRMPPIESEVPA